MECRCECWHSVCPGPDNPKPSSRVVRSGLPPSLTNLYDSASESEEEEDEADEDSNGCLPFMSMFTSTTNIPSTAEEYYKNDYPEEDDPSSDSDSGDSLYSFTLLFAQPHLR